MRPFRGRTLQELLVATTRGLITPPARDVALPGWLRKIVVRGLAPHPDDRWPSMNALLSELARDRGKQRRRMLGVAAAVGCALLGAAGVASGMGEEASACAGVSALEGVWGPEEARALETSVRDSGVVYAAETWARLGPAIDRYADDWRRARADACDQHQRGYHSAQLYDRTVMCLDRRKDELAAAVQVLTRADGEARVTAVEHAQSAISGLTPVSVCGDVERLMSAPLVPEEPSQRAAVDELRGRLATVSAQRRAGQYDAGLPVAEALVRDAEAADYPPALAEALLERGLLRGHTDDHAGADADLSAALWAAEASRHERVAITASQQRLLLYAEQMADIERARRWTDHARALVERAGEPRARADLEFILGVLSMNEGRFHDARDELARALEMARTSYGEDELMLARVRRSYASTLNSLGEFDEARVHLEAAVRSVERALGPRHPRLAQMLLTLGNLHIGQGRDEAALTAYERALTITRDALGPDHATTGAMLLSVGLVHSQRRENAEARALFERSLEIFERAYGPEHPNVAVALANLASVESAELPAGELDAGGLAQAERALEHYQRARALLETLLGPEHKNIAAIQTGVAGLLRRRGELEEAAAMYRAATELLERALGPEHHELALPLAGLARVALDRGRPREAIPLLERAIERRSANDESALDLAGDRWLLGAALWSSGQDRVRGRALIELAHESYAGAGPSYQRDADETAAWLAEHTLDAR
ncbi:MAG: tetratricopeptide repeat protein [Myxococcales bacterium]|nr:tetratricopeptide repeat protein [Myxococcales bacterium]